MSTQTSTRTTITVMLFKKPISLWALFVGLLLGATLLLLLGVAAWSPEVTQALTGGTVSAPSVAAVGQKPLLPAVEQVLTTNATNTQAPQTLDLAMNSLDGITGGDGGEFDPEVEDQGGNCIQGYVIDVYGQRYGGASWEVNIQQIRPTKGDLKRFQVGSAGDFVTLADLSAGTYQVTLVFPEGWREFTPASFSVTLSGDPDEGCAVVRFKLEALANLVVTKVDPHHTNGASSVGLPGWIISLIDPLTGATVMTATTDGVGNAYFNNIPSGTWTIAESGYPGWQPVSPPQATIILVSPIVPGTAQYHVFVNEQVHEGAIYVEKKDIHGNLITGWDITLIRDDGTQPTLVGRTGVAFTGLELGDYTVVEAVDPFWASVSGTSTEHVKLSVPGEVAYVTFVNEALGCIDGYKINHFGAGLDDWEIKAYDTASKVYTATTDDTGYFKIILPLGTWTVEEEVQEDWTPVTPSLFSVEVKTPLTCERVRFKNRANAACVDVYKKDTHGDVGIPGWLIKIKAQYADDSTAVSAITDGIGWVRFTDLAPGHYTVWEGEQPGWIAITPKRYDLNLEATGSCAVVTFYNKQEHARGPIDVPTPPPAGPGWRPGDHYGCRGFYTVLAGDTLYRIATRYGTTWQAVQQANNLSSSVIYAGMQLCIP